MATFDVERTIGVPPQTAWDVLVDAEKLKDWFPNVKSAHMDGGADPSPGAKREVHLDVDGKDLESHQVITAMEVPRQFSWKHERDVWGGKPFDMFGQPEFKFVLSAETGGTKVHVHVEYHPQGFKGKALAPLAKKLFGKQVEEALGNLEKLLK